MNQKHQIGRHAKERRSRSDRQWNVEGNDRLRAVLYSENIPEILLRRGTYYGLVARFDQREDPAEAPIGRHSKKNSSAYLTKKQRIRILLCC